MIRSEWSTATFFWNPECNQVEYLSPVKRIRKIRAKIETGHEKVSLFRPFDLVFCIVSYQVFARKYRPQDFDTVVGQEHITRTLKNAIEQNRLAHAYLFVGPRGVGKTSTARILAKALNCEKGQSANPCGKCQMCRDIASGASLNVMEFDAASNTQVDKIREIIIENVKYAPTSGKYKLYIVDEVHMLSNSSFNALLKTLEEPPSHVIFIFATTDVQKVPTTIISRCQRFDLRRIPAKLIAEHLQFIAKQEKISLHDAAAQAIAKGAEGGLRDAESMLDQLVAFCGNKITEADVLSVFGFTAQQTVSGLCEHILNGDSPAALAVVQQQAADGKDLSKLLADLIGHFRDLLVTKASPNAENPELDAAALALLKSQAGKIATDRLLELIDLCAGAESRMKWAPNKKLHFEVAVIKAINSLQQATLSEVIDTLAVIRAGGEPVAASIPPRRESAGPALPTSPVARPQTKPQPANNPPSTPTVAQTGDPSTATVGESVEPVAGGDFWLELLKQIRARRPLISNWVEAGTLASVENDICLIAFPKDQKMAMESIQRPTHRKFLEELLASVAGRAMVLKCEIREGLAVTPPQLPAAKEEPIVDPKAKAHDDFKNDPKIRKAMEIFEAEIIST
jgi:DNA polymerase-3 subunit gamma/tau